MRIPSSIRRLLPLVAIAGALLAAPSPAAAQDMRWVEGAWGWLDDDGPHCDFPSFIDVVENGKYVRMVYSDTAHTDTAMYLVLGVAPRVIRGRIQGEKRMDDAGKPVVWDFVSLDADAFCWHRADWANDGCTRPLVRCAAPASGGSIGRAGPFIPRRRSPSIG